MDWSSVLVAGLGALSGGGITALFTLKGKRKAVDIENDGKMYDEYKEYIERLKEDIREEKAEKEEFKIQVTELWKEINELKRKLAVLDGQLAHASVQLYDAETHRCDKADTCPMRVCDNNRGPALLATMNTIADESARQICK